MQRRSGGSAGRADRARAGARATAPSRVPAAGASIDAARPPPSHAPFPCTRLQRAAIRQAVTRYRLSNPRVFGSVLLGNDDERSDLDLLVDAALDTTLFELGGLQDELEELLGVPVDVLTPDDLPARWRDQVLSDARPL